MFNWFRISAVSTTRPIIIRIAQSIHPIHRYHCLATFNNVDRPAKFKYEGYFGLLSQNAKLFNLIQPVFEVVIFFLNILNRFRKNCFYSIFIKKKVALNVT